jgi:hypothetical protein
MRNGIICAAAAAVAAAEIISGNKLHQLLYIASRYIEILLALESTEKKIKSPKLLYSPNEKPVPFRSALFELLEGDSHLPPNVCSTKILDYTF